MMIILIDIHCVICVAYRGSLFPIYHGGMRYVPLRLITILLYMVVCRYIRLPSYFTWFALCVVTSDYHPTLHG